MARDSDSVDLDGGGLELERRPLAPGASSSTSPDSIEVGGGAREGAPDDAALPYGVLWRRCWKLMLATILLNMHGDIDARILTPYFYTRVSCCQPGRESPTLPDVMTFSGREFNLSITAESCKCSLAETYLPYLAAENRSAALRPGGWISACDVPQISRDSPLWSHSAECVNWPFVREQTQVLMAAWGSLTALVSVLVIPSLGNVADLYGRLQIFLWSSVVVGIGFAIFTIDAAFHLSDGWIVISGLVFGASRAHGPAAWAMLMDLIPPGSRLKWFPVMSAMTSAVAPLLGEAIAFPFLAMHLTDYTIMWAALCGFGVAVLGFIYCFLEETLPPERAKPWGGWGELGRDLSPFSPGYRHGLRLWCSTPEPAAGETEASVRLRGRVLRIILVSSLLAAFAAGVFSLAANVLLGALHFKQEELVFLGIFSKVVAIPAALSAALIVPAIGCYWSWVLGSCAASLGFLCFTTLGHWGPYVTMLIWTLSFSLVKPASYVHSLCTIVAGNLRCVFKRFKQQPRGQDGVPVARAAQGGPGEGRRRAGGARHPARDHRRALLHSRLLRPQLDPDR